ncbi:isopenicillin N synthase family oxygenase [Sphingomonas sp. MAH-20]|jgi:isopenicillin N synthase-like dioxygenase|uniref:2-oxoglutarate-dependent ethylene/succinate-forming enzyme n=1 Tax=Sphingomonas horti TaxID=2682842 RepID=A0A6I4IZD4_9SPHN|nr:MULTISPECIES: 2-oxoglutarate and iron-dependent oxygenase domain-containing protein [Sphingomonas]MBA2920589.1 isopenicillin N synthase family oxygenase [Sphingomonas sp. CGMCC 1.13658]MVO77525.1 isopenicillin N synthase family oxygenase [Sphingomonas horti]
MLDTVSPTIPPLSLARQADDPDGFAQDFGASFHRFGFGVIKDHGIGQALIDRGWALTKAFFDLPTEVKAKYHLPGKAGARGYTPFGIETAKGATENDLKEFWHVGRELPAGHRFADVMPPNVWPDEVPGLKETFLALYAEFDRVGAKLLSAIAVYLGLAPDWFVEPVRDGNSVMRLLHYPPVSPEAPGVRAGAHEDINLITLLLGAEEAGLQLLDRDGRWLAISPPEGALVVNVGDMLQRLTNHVLPSTTHRVVNPAPERRGTARYSMPFFLHPAPDFVIETLPGCITPDNPNRYPEPISSQEYLNQRLRTLGLLKDDGVAG